MLISIIVPVYNEESNILAFDEALSRAFEPLDHKTELIFIDDGSTDNTFVTIQELAANSPRVKSIRFSRNFGSHAAILAGLRNAKGDVAVVISVDLQDPPELIPRMIEKWKEGNQVVWAARESRSDALSKKLLANIFYWVFRKIALSNYPRQGMDFGLFDRKVIDSLKEVREANQFIIGTILWLGFKQTYLSYHRRARHSGTTKWPFWKRLKSALDAIVSFSYFPIRLISYLGLFVSCLSIIYACILIFNRIYWGLGGSGWPSVMVAILFLGGVQLIMLGILGEYVWRGSDQVKGRPQYIVMDSIGFESHQQISPVNATERKVAGVI